MSEFTTVVNIKAEMARRGVLQRDVAIALGIDQAGVSNRLTGKSKLSADELVAIAQLLDVSVSVLVGEPAQAAS